MHIFADEYEHNRRSEVPTNCGNIQGCSDLQPR